MTPFINHLLITSLNWKGFHGFLPPFLALCMPIWQTRHPYIFSLTWPWALVSSPGSIFRRLEALNRVSVHLFTALSAITYSVIPCWLNTRDYSSTKCSTPTIQWFQCNPFHILLLAASTSSPHLCIYKFLKSHHNWHGKYFLSFISEERSKLDHEEASSSTVSQNPQKQRLTN